VEGALCVMLNEYPSGNFSLFPIPEHLLLGGGRKLRYSGRRFHHPQCFERGGIYLRLRTGVDYASALLVLSRALEVFLGISDEVETSYTA
jgi:hypothetical protein